MGLIFIIPLGVLAGWSIARIFRWLKHGDFGREWWRTFAISSVAGLALGVFFVFFLNYRVVNKRIAGFPIPLAIATLADGNWTNYDVPPLMRYPGMVTDLLSGVALCLAPIALAAFIRENRGKLGVLEKPPAGNP